MKRLITLDKNSTLTETRNALIFINNDLGKITHHMNIKDKLFPDLNTSKQAVQHAIDQINTLIDKIYKN